MEESLRDVLYGSEIVSPITIDLTTREQELKREVERLRKKLAKKKKFKYDKNLRYAYLKMTNGGGVTFAYKVAIDEMFPEEKYRIEFNVSLKSPSCNLINDKGRCIASNRFNKKEVKNLVFQHFGELKDIQFRIFEEYKVEARKIVHAYYKRKPKNHNNITVSQWLNPSMMQVYTNITQFRHIKKV